MGQIANKERPGANEAKIATQDVPQLRQFIQAGTAEKRAQAGGTPFVLKQTAVAIAGMCHRSELEASEQALVQSRTHLPEQDGLSHLPAD
jgi:hypothetical protein